MGPVQKVNKTNKSNYVKKIFAMSGFGSVN